MLKIYYGNCSSVAEKELLKSIDKNDIFSKKIIITPDRFTLSVERQLYEILGINGSFNINTLTFLRLAKKFVSEKKTLSKEGTALLVSKIIRKNKEKFKHYYKVCDKDGFSAEIFTAVAKLKLTDIPLSELYKCLEKAEGTVKNKFHDVLLILKEYNDLIEEKYGDKSDRLDLLTNLIYDGVFDNYEFFILGFNRPDGKELRAIYALIERAKNLSVSLLRNDQYPQKYNDGFYKKLTAFCVNNNLTYQEIQCYENLNKGLSFINQNLFSLNFKYADDSVKNTINLVKANDCFTEIELTAKKVAELIDDKGYRYKEIAVLNADKSLNSVIERIFTKYKIPYFIDKKYSLNNTLIVNFYKCLNELYLKNLRREEVLSFLKNPLIGIENIDDFENISLAYNLSFDRFKKPLKNDAFNDIQKILLTFYERINNFYKAKNVNCEELFAFLEEINRDYGLENKIENFFENDNGLYKEANLLAVKKISEAKSEIFNILQDERLSCKEMFDAFFSLIGGMEISLIPQSLDCVFVGELEESRFNEIRILFVVNASQKCFPRNFKYDSILSERDIYELQSYGVDLSPTPIDDINYEEDLILDFFTKPTEKIYISYSNYDINGTLQNPSSVFTELVNMGFNLEKCNLTNDYEKIFIQDGGFNSYVNYYFNTDADDNYLTKVSQLESYFCCPYKHHIDYGIKPKKRLKGNLEVFEIGTIIHNTIERFFKKNIKVLEKMSTEEIIFDCDIILNEIFSEERLKYIIEDKLLNYTFVSLRKEVHEIVINLIENIRFSNFKPKFVELKFGRDNQFKEIVIDNNDKRFKFRGAIDRVDVCGNNVIIIDYKSGAAKPELKRVMTGEKIQLYLYLKNFLDLGYQISGVFYMKLSDGYNRDSRSYKMEGQILNEESNFKNLDINLVDFKENESPSSKILAFNFKSKDGKLTCTSRSNALEKETFDLIVDYVIKISSVALDEIKEGYREKKPLNGKCEVCPYINICGEIPKENLR